MDSGGYQTVSGLCENLLEHSQSWCRVDCIRSHWHAVAVRPGPLESFLVFDVVNSDVGETGCDVGPIAGS